MMLKDKTAIVTGAARGIGRGVALEFARQGANLVLNYRGSVELTESLIKEIEAFGGKAVADVGFFLKGGQVVEQWRLL